MSTRLRTRLLVSSLVTIGIVIGLLAFVIIERLTLNQRIDRLAQLVATTTQARELGLYVQYNAHDANAYTLGHLEHRAEFTKHAAAFQTILSKLQQEIDRGLLDEIEQTGVDHITKLRSDYDQAATALFAAADRQRAAPSVASQAQVDATWTTFDQLGDQLDGASQDIHETITTDVTTLQTDLATRNQETTTLVILLGLVIIAVIMLIQFTTARAIGTPVRALLTGMREVAAGKLETRVPVLRNDEIGEVASTFNTMTSRLQQQTHDLQVQSKVAQAAHAEAEAARAETTAQLTTITSQQQVIREMSVPILPLTDSALVMPLVGNLDSARLVMVQERALRMIERHMTRYLILDITGVAVIDTQVAQALLHVVHAARLLGADVILVGIQPEVAETMVSLGIRLESVMTRSTLQDGIRYVLQADKHHR